MILKENLTLLKHYLRINKGRTKKLIKKIDKFADEKVSHMVNLKTIKNNLFSDSFEEEHQIRSLSRTFTGGINSLHTGTLIKLGEVLQFPSPLGMSVMESPKIAPLKEDFTISIEENKDIEHLENSTSCIGDFYEIPIHQNRSSVYIKGNFKKKNNMSPSKTLKEEIHLTSPVNLSTQLRDNNKDDLAPVSGMIIEETKSLSNSKEDEGIEHGETAEEQERRIRRQSIFGHLKTWKLLRIIVKSGDDLRQEQFAMQLISQIDQIFKKKKLNIWLKPYEILATGKDCGLIEFLTDAVTIDALK